MDSAYRPDRRVEPPTGRLFPNDLLQLRPVGRRRLGDVQLTHCLPFELVFFFFFFFFFFSHLYCGGGPGNGSGISKNCRVRCTMSVTCAPR